MQLNQGFCLTNLDLQCLIYTKLTLLPFTHRVTCHLPLLCSGVRPRREASLLTKHRAEEPYGQRHWEHWELWAVKGKEASASRHGTGGGGGGQRGDLEEVGLMSE